MREKETQQYGMLGAAGRPYWDSKTWKVEMHIADAYINLDDSDIQVVKSYWTDMQRKFEDAETTNRTTLIKTAQTARLVQSQNTPSPVPSSLPDTSASVLTVAATDKDFQKFAKVWNQEQTRIDDGLNN